MGGKLTQAEVQLIEVAVTVAATSVPKLIAFLMTLGESGRLSAAQTVEHLSRSRGISESVRAESRRALAEAAGRGQS